MSKETKEKNSQSGIFYGVSILIGAIAGGFGATFFANIQDKYFSETVPGFIVISFVAFSLLISVFLVVLIHEAGHLVMGLLTGYEFVSFRVGSLTWVKENEKLVRKKFAIAGTGGQCIMTHARVEHPEDIPFFWYHFGGVFFNIITVCVSVLVVIFAPNPFVKIGFAMLGLVSAALGIVNILPTKSTGVATDGYNLALLMKSKLDRVCIYKLLLINAMQYEGVKLEDMPKELTTFSDEEKSCESGAALRVIETNMLLDRHEFEQAEMLYAKLSNDDDMPGVYKNECLCEQMFCMIMNGKSKAEINKVYDKKLKQYIEATGKYYVMRKRLMYAYYRLVEKDDEKANKEYELAENMKNTYPSVGEYLAEMELMQVVAEKPVE